MRFRMVVIALVAALTPVFVMASPAAAATVTKTLTFDEIAATPANGVHLDGVRFGFSVAGKASTNATYGGLGPGVTKFVSDPSLEGDATGTLTLTFDKPTKLLQFGAVLDATGTLTPGFTVNLFDKTGASLGTIPVTTKKHGTPLSEALFKKTGVAIKKAVITFDGVDAPRFALDNLTYKVKVV
jgi:hypothetical protein